MCRKTFLMGLVLAFLLSFVLGALFVTPVRAAKTWTVDDDGPADFSTIQAAINAASNGDTIQVASGIYYENVVVNKSLTLVGENSRTTIIDGNETWHVVHITVSNVEISGFTIRNGMGKGSLYVGIWVYRSCDTISDIIIRNNIILDNYIGVNIHFSDDCVVSGNTITNSQYGIKIHFSSGNTVSSNTVSSNSLYGMHLYYSNDNNIVGNTISYNNKFANEIKTYGVYIGNCSGNNILYHNNFVNNTIQAYDNETNVWDNGYPSGGNYWSDYLGVDEKHGPNQNQPGSDGIGDTPYVIDSDSQDNYPLMYPFSLILIDEAYVSDDRVDVGSFQTVGFHAKWTYDGSDVVGGSIYVNETEYVTNQNGWISFNAIYNTVGKRSWTVTNASFNGITNYKQVVSDPSIIWDRVHFTLSVEDRIDVGSSAPISWTGIYEYDGEFFTGSVSFNDTIVKESVGKYGYEVQNISDPNYGLTAFTSTPNSVSVIFDRLEVYGHGVTDTRCDVGSSQRVWVKVRYDYDDVIFDEGKGGISIGGISAIWDATNTYWYISVSQDTVTKIDYLSPSSFTDNIYNLTVISGSVTQSVIWDRISITLSVEDRIDVGSSAPISWTGIYEYDGEFFTGSVSLNDTTVKEDVGKYGYSVQAISDPLYGIKNFTFNTVDCIWDRVHFTLVVADDRIDVGSSAPIGWTGTYEYDGAPFTGSVSFNDSLTKDVVGKYWYMVESIDDPTYGITTFETDIVSCIFDKVMITLSVAHVRIEVGSTAEITWVAVYGYDNTEYDGVVALNDTLTKLEGGRYGYTVSSISGDTHGITAFESNSVYVIFEEEAAFPLWIVGVLGGLVVLLTLAIFLAWRRRKRKASSTA